MKRSLALTAACIIAIAAVSAAQQTPPAEKPESPSQSVRTPGKLTPLRVQLVISRYMGEKKISSLPYTLWVTANESARTSVRMGSDVPVVTTVFTGEKDKATIPQKSWNYRSVGTNIDCTASSAPDGAYRVTIVLNDSSIQFDPKAGGQSPSGVADAPVFRNFSSNFAILLRDGQTAQYTSATDPVSGEVLKVDVTLNVLK